MMLPAVGISYCRFAGIVDGELAMFCPCTPSIYIPLLLYSKFAAAWTSRRIFRMNLDKRPPLTMKDRLVSTT